MEEVPLAFHECQHILCRAPDFKKHLQNHMCNVTNYILKSCFILISSMSSLIPLIFFVLFADLAVTSKMTNKPECMCFWNWYFWMFNIYLSLSTYLSIVPQKGHHQKTQRQGSLSRSSHLSFVLMREMGFLSPQKMPMDPEKPAIPLEYHMWVVPLK